MSRQRPGTYQGYMNEELAGNGQLVDYSQAMDGEADPSGPADTSSWTGPRQFTTQPRQPQPLAEPQRRARADSRLYAVRTPSSASAGPSRNITIERRPSHAVRGPLEGRSTIGQVNRPEYYPRPGWYPPPLRSDRSLHESFMPLTIGNAFSSASADNSRHASFDPRRQPTDRGRRERIPLSVSRRQSAVSRPPSTLPAQLGNFTTESRWLPLDYSPQHRSLPPPGSQQRHEWEHGTLPVSEAFTSALTATSTADTAPRNQRPPHHAQTSLHITRRGINHLIFAMRVRHYSPETSTWSSWHVTDACLATGTAADVASLHLEPEIHNSTQRSLLVVLEPGFPNPPWFTCELRERHLQLPDRTFTRWRVLTMWALDAEDPDFVAQMNYSSQVLYSDEDEDLDLDLDLGDDPMHN